MQQFRKNQVAFEIQYVKTSISNDSLNTFKTDLRSLGYTERRKLPITDSEQSGPSRYIEKRKQPKIDSEQPGPSGYNEKRKQSVYYSDDELPGPSKRYRQGVNEKSFNQTENLEKARMRKATLEQKRQKKKRFKIT